MACLLPPTGNPNGKPRHEGAARVVTRGSHAALHVSAGHRSRIGRLHLGTGPSRSGPTAAGAVGAPGRTAGPGRRARRQRPSHGDPRHGTRAQPAGGRTPCHRDPRPHHARRRGWPAGRLTERCWAVAPSDAAGRRSSNADLVDDVSLRSTRWARWPALLAYRSSPDRRGSRAVTMCRCLRPGGRAADSAPRRVVSRPPCRRCWCSARSSALSCRTRRTPCS
jgi:hypothetical protein